MAAPKYFLAGAIIDRGDPDAAAWVQTAVGDGSIAGRITVLPTVEDLDRLRPVYRLRGALAWTDWTDIESPAVGSTFTITGLTNNVEYEVSVVSVDDAGDLSAMGSLVRATPTDLSSRTETELDEELIPEVLSMINEFGYTAIFTTYSSETHDPTTSDVTKSGGDSTTRKISPPRGFNPRLIDGENIRSGDQLFLVAASGLPFTPYTGMLVTFGTQKWRMITIWPILSGEFVAAYKVQIRRSGS